MPLRSPPPRGRRRDRLANSEMTSPTLRCCWVAIAFAAIRTSSSIAKVVLMSASSRINHQASNKQKVRLLNVDTVRTQSLNQSVHRRKRNKFRLRFRIQEDYYQSGSGGLADNAKHRGRFAPTGSPQSDGVSSSPF
jgi:hypothetical protein